MKAAHNHPLQDDQNDAGEDKDLPFPDSDLPLQLQRAVYRKLQEAGGDDDLGEVDEAASEEALREAERDEQHGGKRRRKREKPLKIHGTLNDVLGAAMRGKPKK